MKTCVLLLALMLCACGPQVILEAPRPSWDRCALLRCEAGTDEDAAPTDAAPTDAAEPDAADAMALDAADEQP